jgi:RNA polymerase sigma-70 factor (ECF subfamily)
MSRIEDPKEEHPKAPAPSPIRPALNEITTRLFDHESAFRAYLRKRLDQDHLIEDLWQHSLTRAVERHHELKNTESAVPWFYRILRHAVADYYRAKAAELRKTEGLSNEMELHEENQVPALDAVRPTVCACLGSLLSELRPAYAEVITRIDLQGEQPATVAKDLRLTGNNLTVRLHRARQALKHALEDACGVCTKHGCVNCTCG